MKHQRGGTLLGFIIGVVIGLAAALAVAVYVTKVPVPFMNKGAEPQRRPGRGRGQARTRTGTPTPRCTARTRPSRCRRPPAHRRARARRSARHRAAPATRPSAQAPRQRSRRPSRRASADPLGDLAAARNGRRGSRSVHLLRAGRRLPHARRRRGPARQAVADGHRGQGDRARAVRPHGVPRARRPLRARRTTPTAPRKSSKPAASKPPWCASSAESRCPELSGRGCAPTRHQKE